MGAGRRTEQSFQQIEHGRFPVVGVAAVEDDGLRLAQAGPRTGNDGTGHFLQERLLLGGILVVAEQPREKPRQQAILRQLRV